MQPSCPFCHRGIDDALALHGGNCPHCFVEIPGEETATDPGEAVKARLVAEDQTRARRRAMLPVVVVAPFVIAVVGFAAWSLRPQPEVEALNLGADEFAFEIDLATYEPPEPSEEAPPAGEVARPRAASVVPTPRPRPELSGPSGDLGDRLAAANRVGEASGSRARGGSAEAPTAGVRDIGGLAAGDAGGSADLDVSFQARRTAALLSSRSDIQSAVTDMMRARSPRLQQCYDRSLKANDGLRGQWRLSFTIGKDGAVASPEAAGEDMSDPAFEDCLVREMASWRIYGRLAKPWPVSLPVTFKNGG